MKNEITTDHVIEGYLLDIENRPQWAHRYTLLRYLRLYPEHAAALVEHVELEAIIAAAPDETTDPEAEAAIVRRGMEIARKLLEKKRREK